MIKTTLKPRETETAKLEPVKSPPPAPPKEESPTLKELREFGLTMAAILGGGFGSALPLFKHGRVSFPWLGGALAFLIFGLLAPQALKWVYVGWMALGSVLGYVNSRILLGVIYYVGVVPMGVLMQWFGRDPMARHFDEAAVTYRVKRPAEFSPRGMERPF